MKKIASNVLWYASDHLIRYRKAIPLAHWLGELGWKIRNG